MSVRLSLLALLHEAPSYGNLLRSEYLQRTAGTRPLNVGQVYTTLERLARDKLVEAAEPDAQGHQRYRLTAAGEELLSAWWRSRDADDDDLVAKIALAASLPSVDALAVIESQQAGDRAELATLQATTDRPVAELFRRARLATLTARLTWLDEARDAVASGTLSPIAPAAEPPKRGRPPRAQPEPEPEA